MSSVNQWWFFSEAISKTTCNKIIELAGEKWEKGLIYDEQSQERKTQTTDRRLEFQKEHPNLRNNEIQYVNEQWLFDLVFPYLDKANESAGWKYDIRSARDPQISKYSEGEFVGLHADGRGDHLSVYNEPGNINTDGYVKKLSMSILLNDDFEGGEFQFCIHNLTEHEFITPEHSKLGSIIIFPSDILHRVKSVTKGIRYSLAVWFLGPPFV